MSSTGMQKFDLEALHFQGLPQSSKVPHVADFKRVLYLPYYWSWRFGMSSQPIGNHGHLLMWSDFTLDQSFKVK